ncbi:thermonuclease family protein [Chenggangzhangella methanolivorans]|uniref:thermonuclease family protein n=1 Tax=Chenggangzhangella methanolivorans TaxID=1437009 RepID=UPI00361DD115
MTPQAAGACALASAHETVAVERVIDGDTLALDDGRLVRLAGVEAPKAPLGTKPSDWPLEAAAREALGAAAAGKVLELRPARVSPDRRGRALGYLTEIGDADHAGLTAALLRSGTLRVAADPAGRDCRATLAEAEAAAVRSRLGLWSEPYYEVQDASDGAALAALDGRFVVAEGRVASVRTLAGRAYVNFGRRWRGALSLTLSEAALRRFGGFDGLGVAAGARVRARGVLEMRAGPTIRVSELAQVERLDAGRADGRTR